MFGTEGERVPETAFLGSSREGVREVLLPGLHARLAIERFVRRAALRAGPKPRLGDYPVPPRFARYRDYFLHRLAVEMERRRC